jgi:RNA polymerase sigma-70 factor (ECF subfamily)
MTADAIIDETDKCDGMDDLHQSEAEWQEWLERHAGKFLLFARQKTRIEADAQDLVQEAVFEATKKRKENAPPEPALVFATIHRRAIDLARSNQRRAGREIAAGGATQEMWFDTSVEDRERVKMIQAALEKLPEIYREVITLKLWGELTFAEIARALDISANTAASRYRYALEHLKKHLSCCYERV